MKSTDHMVSENGLRIGLKLWMPPMPAVFKMATRTAITKIKQEERTKNETVDAERNQ